VFERVMPILQKKGYSSLKIQYHRNREIDKKLFDLGE